MGRGALAFAALLALVGCATPLQLCLAQAEHDVLAVQRELDERRQTLRRGYAVERVAQPARVSNLCAGAGAAAVTCLLMEPETLEIRHAINPTFEAERVALLERQLARAQTAQAQAAAQCRVTYPE